MATRRQFLKATVGGILSVRGVSGAATHTGNEIDSLGQQDSIVRVSSSTIDRHPIPTIYLPQGGSIDISKYFGVASSDYFELDMHSSPLPRGITLSPNGMLSADQSVIAGTVADNITVITSTSIRRTRRG